MLSLLTKPPNSASTLLLYSVEFGLTPKPVLLVGEGIMSGLEARSKAVPIAPTEAERRKPVLERSIMYQRTGLTRARVREA